MNRSHEIATREFYRAVFDAETDRVPIIVTPPCPGMPDMPARVADPTGETPRVARALEPKRAVESDWIPVVPFAYYQCVAVPSLYGARISYPDGSVPIPEPLFESTAQAARARLAESSALVDEMMGVLERTLDALPEGYALGISYSSSPFDLAQMLVPGAVFSTDLFTEPQACEDFLGALTEAVVAMVHRMRERTDSQRDDTVTTWGTAFSGLRLPSDAIVNYSPDLLRRFAVPVLERLGREFGPLCIHYCTKPAQSAHVLGPLSQCPAVRIVDAHQGYDEFLGPDCPAHMQERTAVAFRIDLRREEAMRELLDLPAVRQVPRRGGRGIVVHTPADSVEDGRRIVARWRELSS